MLFRRDVHTIAKSGSTQLTGDVTLSEGSNITLTQTGNDIAIASTGGGSMAIGGTVTSGTTGSILYVAAGPVLAQDNANFFYDSANTRLRVPEIAGGTASGGTLNLYSTTHATKGDINLEGFVDIYPSLTASTTTDIVHMMPTLTQSAGSINYFRISPTATISGAGVITRVFTCDGTWTQSGSSIFNIYNMFYSAATLQTSDTNVPPAPLTFYNQTSYNIKHGVGTTSVVVKGYTDQGSIVASAAAATSVVIAGYTSFDTIPQLSATHASASMTITNRIGYNVGDITSTATGSITVTNNIGINVVNLTQGTSGSRTYNNAYGIYSVMATGTNKYFINSDADAPSLHQGHFRIGKASTTASELQFANATNSNITAFKAGVATAAVTYTLPTADGTSGQVLKTNGSGTLSWTTAAGSSPLTTKGDIFTYSTVDARLAVGANGTVLTANSAETTGLKWTNPYGFNVFGSTLTVGGTATTALDIAGQTTCEMVMPFAGEIYAISIGTSADRTAGTLTARYKKNGTSDATNTAVIDGTNVRRFYRLFSTPVTFAAGDYISLETVTASFTPTGNDALVTLYMRRT